MLELDCVHTGVGRHINEAQCLIEPAIMIAPGLRDDKTRFAVAHPPVSDFQPFRGDHAQASTIARATRCAPNPSTSSRPSCPMRCLWSCCAISFVAAAVIS